MTEREKTAMPPPDPPEDAMLLRLYIAGSAPNSLRALANLEAIRQEYLGDRCRIEVIDIFQEPLRALDDGILLTPTLAKVTPPPVVKIVGDLRERVKVLQALGVQA